MRAERAGQAFVGVLVDDGTLAWRRDFDASEVAMRSLEFASDGSAAYTRLYKQPGGSQDVEDLDVVRLDASGMDVFTVSIPPPSPIVLDTMLAVEIEGDVVAGTVFVEEEDPEQFSALFGDTQLTHITASGTIDWQRTQPFTPFRLRRRSDGTWDAIGYCRPDGWKPCRVHLDERGEIVESWRLDQALFSPWPDATGFVGNYAFGLARIDEEAAFLWHREFGHPDCSGEGSSDGCGGGGISAIVLASDGSIIGNGSTSRDGLDVGGGDMKAGRWIGRFAPDGAHIWSRVVECEGFDAHASVDAAGEVMYLCGKTCDEDPGPPPGDAAPVTHTCFRLLVLSP